MAIKCVRLCLLCCIYFIYFQLVITTLCKIRSCYQLTLITNTTEVNGFVAVVSISGIIIFPLIHFTLLALLTLTYFSLSFHSVS